MSKCSMMLLAAVALIAGADEVWPGEETRVDAGLVSRRIDARLGVDDSDPTRFVSDEGFLRRVTLDLAGRIPLVAEVHAFGEMPSESRRSETTNRLLRSGVYYRNMAGFWRRAWVPQADTREFAAVADEFELWLVSRLREGVKYDDLAVELLTFDASRHGAARTSPSGFYDANQSKPENLAASASRALLGVNLDCAQCHDHPFARWTRTQFWNTAAFFTSAGQPSVSWSRPPTIKIPETQIECEPSLLSGASIQWPERLDSVVLRRVLVDWMKSDADRLFAKNAVNRLWSHFFGEAIIEPTDDLSREEFQTGDRAELLSELADFLVESGYDLDILVEGIVGSDAYRLASTPTGSTTRPGWPPRHVAVRGLTGEQLFDSLQAAAGLSASRTDVGRGNANNRRREFAATFFVERTHAAERSISQSLTLMNGAYLNELTSARGNPLLASVLSSPFMNEAEQIDTLFVAVLGRSARPAELRAVKQSFAVGEPSKREQQLGDLFWALVNSSEFNTNR